MRGESRSFDEAREPTSLRCSTFVRRFPAFFHDYRDTSVTANHSGTTEGFGAVGDPHTNPSNGLANSRFHTLLLGINRLLVQRATVREHLCNCWATRVSTVHLGIELERRFLIIDKHARQLDPHDCSSIEVYTRKGVRVRRDSGNVRPGARSPRARNNGCHDFSRKPRTRTSRNHRPPHTRQAKTKAKTTLNQLASART